MKEYMNDKLIPAIMKFVNLKGVIALKDGLLYVMPLTIVGSLFLLLANLPYKPAADWVTSSGLLDPLNQAYGATFNIMALVAVVGIAYTYVKREGFEPLNAGIISLVTFVLTTSSTVTDAKTGVSIANVIPKDWTAGQGMVTAILIGLFVGYVYSWFMKKDIRIKMPSGVPEGVANSFTSLVPALFIITVATLVYSFFKFGLDTTLVESIYAMIQAPLQGMTDSLGGVIFMGLTIPFLWWFGVHGSTIVGGIMGPILQSNSLANQKILDLGQDLTVANGGHIVTQQFLDQFMTVTGAGMTIGIVMYMIFFSKSAQLRQLGKLGGIPGLFNINEPVLFGTPIVMNPFMFLPFILMPVISGIILYFSMYLGLVPLFGGVLVPWTTPPIISGFLVGGWQAALLQAIILILTFFVYFPFIRKVDKLAYENEQASSSDDTMN